MKSGEPDATGAQHADEMANTYARHTAELVLDFGWRDVFRPAAVDQETTAVQPEGMVMQTLAQKWRELANLAAPIVNLGATEKFRADADRWMDAMRKLSAETPAGGDGQLVISREDFVSLVLAVVGDSNAATAGRRTAVPIYRGCRSLRLTFIVNGSRIVYVAVMPLPAAVVWKAEDRHENPYDGMHVHVEAISDMPVQEPAQETTPGA